MINLKLPALTLAFLAFFLVSCNTSSSGSVDNNIFGDKDTIISGDNDSAVSGDSTINDGKTDNSVSGDDDSGITGGIIEKIQTGEYTVDTQVSFEGVVTGIFYEQDTSFKNTGIQGIYVSERIPEAIPYSGIYIYLKTAAALDSYARGDLLSISGTYKEFYDNSQIESPAISKIGAADEPVPAVITDPSAVSTKFELTANLADSEVSDSDADTSMTYTPASVSGADAEKWESVVIEIRDVAVTNQNLGHGLWEVTGNLAIDRSLFFYSGKRTLGTKFKRITGILTYSYNAFKLAPRATSDIEPETQEETDSDEITGSDADTVVTAAAISDIQKGKYPDKTLVSIEKAMVISPMQPHTGSPPTYSFYVSTGAQGEYSGIYIYKMVQSDIYPVGSWVAITGAVGVYDSGKHYHIQNGSGIKNAVTPLNEVKGTPPSPLTVDAATLMDEANNAKYKGSLVTISNIKVKTASDSYNNVELEGGLIVSENFLPNNTLKGVAAGTQYTGITGIFDELFAKNTLMPLKAADIVKTKK